MPIKISKILWSLVILFLTVTTVIFSFGIILIGAVAVGLFAIYSNYLRKKRSTRFKVTPQKYMFGEVIDIKAEVIDQPVLDKNKYNIKN